MGLDGAYEALKKRPLSFAALGTESHSGCRPGHVRQALYIRDEIAAKEGPQRRALLHSSMRCGPRERDAKRFRSPMEERSDP
jgi:hypothetical protein